jgi:hypothetical protein
MHVIRRCIVMTYDFWNSACRKLGVGSWPYRKVWIATFVLVYIHAVAAYTDMPICQVCKEIKKKTTSKKNSSPRPAIDRPEIDCPGLEFAPMAPADVKSGVCSCKLDSNPSLGSIAHMHPARDAAVSTAAFPHVQTPKRGPLHYKTGFDRGSGTGADVPDIPPDNGPNRRQDTQKRASAFVPVQPRNKTEVVRASDLSGKCPEQPLSQRTAPQAPEEEDIASCATLTLLAHPHLSPLLHWEGINGEINAGPFSSPTVPGPELSAPAPDHPPFAAIALLPLPAYAPEPLPPLRALTAACLSLDAPLQRLMLAPQPPAAGVAGSWAAEYRSLPGFLAYPGRPGTLAGH